MWLVRTLLLLFKYVWMLQRKNEFKHKSYWICCPILYPFLFKNTVSCRRISWNDVNKKESFIYLETLGVSWNRKRPILVLVSAPIKLVLKSEEWWQECPTCQLIIVAPARLTRQLKGRHPARVPGDGLSSRRNVAHSRCSANDWKTQNNYNRLKNALQTTQWHTNTGHHYYH